MDKKKASGSKASSLEAPIQIRGARVNNLKNIDIDIPRNSLTVITGVSGSGKSSLAFDTIYAEGQRRYVESLSSYARQFLERMDKPDVDFISGISPAMAIQQKTTTTNPRSTVGTTTEIYDYLRLLYARIGNTFSPISGEQVQKDSAQSVASHILEKFEEGTRFYVLFDLPSHKSRKIHDELAVLMEKGWNRLLDVRTEKLIDMGAEGIPNKLPKREAIAVLVDRLAVKHDDETRTRLSSSIETAFRDGNGNCTILIKDGEKLHFSERFERDGMEFIEPTPQMFAFNNPYGACSVCEGFGRVAGIDENLVIPDIDKSLRDGAIAAFSSPKYAPLLRDLITVAARYRWPIDMPYHELSKEIKKAVWDGKDEFIGLNNFFEDVRSQNYKVHMRVFYARYRGYGRCTNCEGYRVRKDALYVKINGLHIGEITEMTIGAAKVWFDELKLTDFEKAVASQILYEIQKRLRYLVDVGLEYLTLDRQTKTLSGGESQRINLANALGSSLIGSLYVLDEPTIGLHPRDNERLIGILKHLRDIGNTVLVVEHDPEMMKAADHIIDIGPFAGIYGGEVVYSGNYKNLLASKSLTARYLNGTEKVELKNAVRSETQHAITITGASEHNLKNLSVSFPLHKMVVVTGVSGSGKSTLVHDTLYGALKKDFGGYGEKVGRHKDLRGHFQIDAIEMVDQSPIGRSPRSNPATYTKAFDGIRDIFSQTRHAKIHSIPPGHFSFNVPGGRCESCQGEGVQTIDMQFMADVVLTCEVCKGKRFKKEVLGITYQGKNIYDVLQMSVTEAVEFFEDVDAIANKLRPLEEVGLGYLKLGQSATTLSGGEAQRVKLARFLTKSEGNHTLYFFDEPTTGLHFDDVNRLLQAFNRLVEQGHSLIVIEHNLDVISQADWIIDIGPEGGFGGGLLVAEGTPEQVMAVERSHTGAYLKSYLGVN